MMTRYVSGDQKRRSSMHKRIIWVSRHPINRVQMGALRRMFGSDVEVTEDPRPFDNAETIVWRVREGGYDDCIVVAPYSVLARMVDLGICPLWADAEQVHDQSRADWSVKDRMYRFLGFKRVKRLTLELEELGDVAKRQDDD